MPPVYWTTASASRGSPRTWGSVAPVVVEKIAERDSAVVVLDFRYHALRRHERLHRARRERVLGEFADDERLQPARGEKLFRLRIERGEVQGHEDVRLAVLDLEFERPQRIERRIIDDRPAGLQHAEKGDRVMRRVGKIEADMHARPDAEPLEARRRAVGKRFELRVRDPLVHELQGGKRAEAPRRLGENALHEGWLDRDVPADALGIGLQPRLSVHRVPCAFWRLFLARGRFGGRRRGGKWRRVAWTSTFMDYSRQRSPDSSSKNAWSAMRHVGAAEGAWAQSVSIGATGCIARICVKSSGVARRLRPMQDPWPQGTNGGSSNGERQGSRLRHRRNRPRQR